MVTLRNCYCSSLGVHNDLLATNFKPRFQAFPLSSCMYVGTLSLEAIFALQAMTNKTSSMFMLCKILQQAALRTAKQKKWEQRK